MAADPDDLLAGLDDQQRAAVTCEAQPLLVVAGAGSGKTRVLTRRIAWRCATDREQPAKVVAVTFTRAAAGELRQRLRSHGVEGSVRAGTFHALALRTMQLFHTDQGRTAPVVLTDPRSLLADVAGSPRAGHELGTELAWARARLVAPDDYPAVARRGGRRTTVAPERLAALMVKYAEVKRRKWVADFDDLLVLATAALQVPDFGAKRASEHGSFYVDELQDVTPLQFELLAALVQGRPNLFAVGDPNQSIYGWGGGDTSFITEPRRWWPDIEILRLTRTYRSTPLVVDAANRALTDGGLLPTTTSYAHEHGPRPTITSYPDEAAEASGIARSLHDHHLPGRSWRQQAVLARTRAQLDVLADGLRAAAIPYRIVGDRTGDDETVRQALRSLRTSTGDFRSAAARLAADLDPDAPIGGEAADRVLGLLDEYERTDPNPTTGGLLAWLALVGVGPDVDTNAVVLTTLHGAKGLEWTVVHLAGCEDGLLPMGRSDESEERKLFYVACTRAMQYLHLTWAEERTLGGKPRRRQRSPYLQSLSQALDDAARFDVPVVPPAGLVPAPAPADRRADALRAWRRHRARVAGVPPAAVLPDHVLRALVAADPAGPADVAAVAGTAHLVAAGLIDDLLDALAPRP